MRPSASTVAATLDFEIRYDDSEPLDTTWHGFQIALLVELAHRAMTERGRDDFHAAGNQFVYWSVDQARTVAREPTERTRHLRGPDFVFVGGVPHRERPCWIVWEEDGRVPDVILELLSPTTAALDRTVKKDEYERSLGAPELFHYDPTTRVLAGWRLVEGRYRDLRPSREGRLYSRGLGLSIGTWRGEYLGLETTWVRLFDAEGQPVPTREEGERTACAEVRRERAAREAAEAELARLRAALAEHDPQAPIEPR